MPLETQEMEHWEKRSHVNSIGFNRLQKALGHSDLAITRK